VREGLYFSEDSGRTWSEYFNDPYFQSFDIDFVDSRHGWMIARNMVYYTKTGDRIVSNLESKSRNQINFNLSQNYPNPFNPKTYINYSIPNAMHLKIAVYNVMGQNLITLINKKMPAGNHQVTFAPQNLSSGIYYYRIEAGEFHKVKKMIYIK
jgi:hypothetical protein